MKAHASPPPSVVSSPSTSPLPSPLPNRQTRMTAAAKRYKYLRRIFRFQQMDFEFAIWQMIYLLISPQKVYRNFQYRKQTKDQFARDDPAFLVLLSICLCGSSILFSLVLGFSFVQFLKFLLWVVFIDCIGVGMCIATIFWFVSNKYLRKPTCMDQDVEWGYAFDVHLNAFFPLLVILHVVQLVAYQLLSKGSFWGLLIDNTFWLVAIGYYIYITFLGYSALPILKNTQVLLYPMTVLVIWFLLSLLNGWNMCWLLFTFYQFRIAG